MAKKVSGTKEWSTSSANVISGCAHGCLYCYAAAQAIRFGRKTPETWTQEELVEKRFGKRQGRIMFPTTHDITEANFQHCQPALLQMLGAGNDVLIVSKPTPRVIESLCHWLAGYKKQVTFRFTIGTLSESNRHFWEPNAPSIGERLYALARAYKAGWDTSVSVEPMLDTDPVDVYNLFQLVEQWVTDTIWLGRMNQALARVLMNGHDGPEVVERVRDLEDAWTDRHVKALASLVGKHPKLRWKESCKKALGIPLETEEGTDK
jgi:DNA repair photolyase